MKKENKPSLSDRINKNCLRIESTGAFLLSLFSWAIWRFVLNTPSFPVFSTQFYANIAQIEATMLGFILTTLGIVFTRLRDERFDRVRDYPAFNQLWRVYVNTMKYLGFGVVVAWLVIIFGPSEILAFLNLFAVIVSIVRVARCVWVLENVIKVTLQPLEPKKIPDPELARTPT